MNIGKVSAVTLLIIFVGGVCLGFALVAAGNGINANVSDSGGGIELAVGFMTIGAGYLVIAVSVLWAALTLIIAASAFLVRWLRTRYNGRNEANTAARQEIGGPNSKNVSKDIESP